ncbi:MAG: S41 family peptidase [Melioribacteraceae bacterium]|nr:S41 family peptidase [Melioribacteraceae bacterium]
MKKIIISTVILLTTLLYPMSFKAAPLDEMKKYVNDYYIGDIKGDVNSISTIEGIEKLLDQYSGYYTKEEFSSFVDSINHELVGVGVIIQEHVNGILIVNVINGGSAESNGIMPGDILLKVDEISLVGADIETAISLLTGGEGTSIHLEVLKPDGAIQVIKLNREKISVPVIKDNLLYGNIGYISLSSFSEDAGQLVANAIEKYKKIGVTSFIFDIRNNGGGFVNAAQDVIGLFPNSPVAFQLHYKFGKEVGLSKEQKISFNENVKVLVNNQSASASEMTAAAIKDQKSGLLYGQQTYGKGTMQSFLPISNGDQFKLTVAEFRSPSGKLINNLGVNPHILTEDGRELEVAHFHHILENIKSYTQLKKQINIPLDKKFTITFSQSIQDVVGENVIELVELGGESVPITLKRIDGKRYQINHQLLKKGRQYLLIINPKISSENNSPLSNGAYFLFDTINQ